jgi:hypothetical protein
VRNTILVFFLVCKINCFSQSSSNLREKFTNADSIILIKHLPTNNPVIINDRTSKKSIQRRLLHGNKLNNSIVQKRIKLNSTQSNLLLNILVAKEKKENRQTMQCFIPRHSIIIYNHLKISYIKLCFECLDSESSADIKLGEEYYSISKWQRLQEYFSELRLYNANEEL